VTIDVEVDTEPYFIKRFLTTEYAAIATATTATMTTATKY
jgi:hypothetical protein